MAALKSAAPQFLVDDLPRALEFYEAVMNTGIPLKVPSQRQ